MIAPDKRHSASYYGVMVKESPRRLSTEHDLDALIREARQRQWRRRLLLVAVLALTAGLITPLYVGSRDSASVAFIGSAGHRPSAPSSLGAVALLKHPAGLAIASNGGLLVIDQQRDQILERIRSGKFRIFAGTGKVGFTGDGGPAVAAELSRPSAMAVTRDGSVYVADTGNNRIREIAPDGTIRTIAGNGRGGWTPNGVRALTAPVESPTALTIAPSGRLYITEGGSGELVRLNRNRTLTRIAGLQGRYQGLYGLGRPATQASVDGADGIGFDKSGNLYLAGFNTKTLLMIDRRGIMGAPLGTKTTFYPRGVGGLATAPSGHVLAMEAQRVVELSPHSVRTLFNFSRKTIAGLAGFLPNGLAVSRSGLVYTDTDYGNGWANGSAIVKVDLAHNQVRTLWARRGP